MRKFLTGNSVFIPHKKLHGVGIYTYCLIDVFINTIESLEDKVFVPSLNILFEDCRGVS